MRAVGLLALVACGHSRPAVAVDGAVDSSADAAPIDAALVRYSYVIDHENVPTTNPQTITFSLDLDNDGMVDNQLGKLLGALQSMGFSVQVTASHAIDTGATLMLADLYTTDFQNAAETTYTMYYGANPQPPACNGAGDTTCRHHLTGTGTFDIAADSPHDTPLAGSAASGTFEHGPGQLGIEITLFVSSTPLEFHLIGARTKLTGVSAAGISSGILAGGVLAAEVNAIFPPMQANTPAIVERDCCGLSTSPGGATCDPAGTPRCGCVDGTDGKTILGLFDTSPTDCMVSLSEIENSMLMKSLIAPDVTLGGVPALSFGMQVTAVPAHF